MKKLALTIFFLSFAFAGDAIASGTHWISANGAAGSWGACQSATPLAGTACCTLTQAFANASAGDQVYLRDGTYASQGTKRTVNSGTSGAKITLQAYTGETVNITGNVEFLILNDYWVIKGINFTNITAGAGGYDAVVVLGYYSINGASYCEVRNCVFDAANANTRVGYLDIWSGGHHTVDSCTFQHHGTIAYADGNLHGLAIGYYTGSVSTYHSDYNVVSNCTFQDMNSYCMVIWNASKYNQVINCTFDQTANTALGISINDGSHAGVTQYNLVDGCTFIGFGSHAPSPGNDKAAIQLYADYCTVRRSVFRDGSGTNPNSCVGIELADGKNNLFYNNVFYNNFRAAVALINNDVRTDTGNKFYNNIFWKNMQANDANGYYQGSQIIWQYPNVSKSSFESSYGCLVDYNFIQYINPDYDPTNHFYMSDATYLMSFTEVHAQFANTFKPTGTIHNIQATGGPGFVNEAGRDFHLVAGSPCINAGVVVNDPVWGNLPYNGSAPDIGAFEYDSGSAPAAPKNLRIVS